MRYVCRMGIAMSMSFTALGGDIFQIVENRDLCALSSVTTDVLAVNSVNKFGDTPLMIAARMGDVSMVKMLLAAGANVEAHNNGFSVKEQLEGYLRRTGESRKEIISVLNGLGVNPQTIESFQKESDLLGGSPSRRASWKAILCLLYDHEQGRSDCNGASKGHSGRTNSARSSIDRGKLKMSDLERVFSMIAAKSNAIQLIVRDKDVCYFAILNNTRAQNICGDEIVSVPVGGSLKLVGKDFLILFTGLIDKDGDESVLWKFDVEFKFVNKVDKINEITLRQGVISARRNGSSKIVVRVD